MRARSIIRFVLTASVLVLPACGDDDSSGSTTSSTTTSVVEDGSSTPEQMKAALLGVDDAGSKWTAMQSQAFTSRTGIPTLDPGIWCPAAADSMAGLGALAGSSGAIVGLRGVGLAQGTSHQITEQVFTGSKAKEFVALVTSGFETCGGTPWTNANGHVVRIDPLVGTVAGDESAAATSTIVTQEAGSDFAYRTRMLVARFGDKVMVLQEVDVQTAGSVPLMMGDEWNSLVAAATSKIDAL